MGVEETRKLPWLYEKWVANGSLRSVQRYNLRRFCRSLGLPSCGLAFWELEDLNWDGMDRLASEFVTSSGSAFFQDGSGFPRVLLDYARLGTEKRIEFVFLTTHSKQHLMWRAFLHHAFSDTVKNFGPCDDPEVLLEAERLRTLLRLSLCEDLIHLGDSPKMINTAGDFYMALFLCTLISKPPPRLSAERVFEAAKEVLPNHRAAISRVLSAKETEDRLDDLLELLFALDGREFDSRS